VIGRALTEGELNVVEGRLTAAATVPLRLPPRPVRRGTYVLAVSLQAAMNADRRSLFLTRAFTRR
jgi:hypothetical protein